MEAPTTPPPPQETPEQHAERMARMQAEMAADGVASEESNYVDYFGFEETHIVYLPDRDGNRSESRNGGWIQHQTLNEGARRHYLNKVNREVRLEKASGSAYMKMATGDERHALLEEAIVNWSIMSRNSQGEWIPVKYTDAKLKDFLKKAPTKIIDMIEKDVRRVNPWLVADVTIEDIDEQIEELQELRDQKVREAEGKES